MPIIQIDDREINTDSLSPEAKQQLDMLIACENKLRELQRDVLITQTARNAYLAAFKGLLPSPLEEMQSNHGDTIKLG